MQDLRTLEVLMPLELILTRLFLLYQLKFGKLFTDELAKQVPECTFYVALFGVFRNILNNTTNETDCLLIICLLHKAPSRLCLRSLI